MGLRTNGFHHVRLVSGDAARSADFYTRVLGFPVVAETPDRLVVAPNSSYTLFDWRGSQYRARAGVGQTHHIAFRASGTDLGEWRDALESRGFVVSPVLDDGMFRMITFDAPDGQAMAISS